MIIAITNAKGGVGKSTLAGNLVDWLTRQGRTTGLVDADVQASSSEWLAEAAPEVPQFRLQTPDDILDQVPKIAGLFDHLVIDGPGGLSELTRTILFIADATFLPCGPSVLDLRAANGAIRVVRQVQNIRKGPPHAVLVPNRLQTRNRLSREFLEVARSLDIPASSGLRLLQPYADAVGQGTFVSRMGRAGEAAAFEIQQLFEELLPDECTTRAPLDERGAVNA